MSYDIAGKVFLLGEYTALMGDPALVAAVGPRFKLKITDARPEISRHSPLGKLIDHAGREGIPVPGFEFVDPHAGSGGFGASTAQFALMYFHLVETSGWEKSWKAAWQLYRKLSSDSQMPPSGADLVSQWCGSVCLFDARRSETEDLWSSQDWSNLLVFSATAKLPSRKTATHEHLNERSVKEFVTDGNPLFKELRVALTSGISAVRESNSSEFGAAMSRTAEVLQEAGFEVTRTTELREKLKKLPGVLGAKGAGAMQSDAFIVLLEPATASVQEIISVCEVAGLKLLANGLTHEPGIQRSAS